MAPVAPVAPKTGMKRTTPATAVGKDLRADAERNRQLLLQAALAADVTGFLGRDRDQRAAA